MKLLPRYLLALFRGTLTITVVSWDTVPVLVTVGTSFHWTFLMYWNYKLEKKFKNWQKKIFLLTALEKCTKYKISQNVFTRINCLFFSGWHCKLFPIYFHAFTLINSHPYTEFAWLTVRFKVAGSSFHGTPFEKCLRVSSFSWTLEPLLPSLSSPSWFGLHRNHYQKKHKSCLPKHFLRS